MRYSFVNAGVPGEEGMAPWMIFGRVSRVPKAGGRCRQRDGHKMVTPRKRASLRVLAEFHVTNEYRDHLEKKVRSMWSFPWRLVVGGARVTM